MYLWDAMYYRYAVYVLRIALKVTNYAVPGTGTVKVISITIIKI